MRFQFTLLLPLLFCLACQPAEQAAGSAGDTTSGADRTKAVDYNPSKDPTPLSDLIQLDGIGAGAILGSPYTLTGKARGGWYFEGSFPVTLKDMDGNVLVSTPAKALDSWMQPGFVPFKAELVFIAGPGTKALLVLEKDNPSSNEGTQRAVEIPVVIR